MADAPVDMPGWARGLLSVAMVVNYVTPVVVALVNLGNRAVYKCGRADLVGVSGCVWP